MPLRPRKVTSFYSENLVIRNNTLSLYHVVSPLNHHSQSTLAGIIKRYRANISSECVHHQEYVLPTLSPDIFRRKSSTLRIHHAEREAYTAASSCTTYSFFKILLVIRSAVRLKTKSFINIVNDNVKFIYVYLFLKIKKNKRLTPGEITNVLQSRILRI